jgi:ankyrin repeat protein
LPNDRARSESLAIAELLLDRGADPNTSWTWTGGETRITFSALAGAMSWN